jgi:chromosomal replication initiation ATPase DnaA
MAWKYTTEQYKFIENNYGVLTANEIAVKLDIRRSAVLNIARFIGKKLSPEKRRIVFMENGRKNISHLHKCMGVVKTNITDVYPGSSIDTLVCLSMLNWDKKRKMVTLDEILAEVCAILDVPPSDIKGRSRDESITDARRLFCYVAYKISHKSLKQIGKYLERDHTSILYLRDTAKTFIKSRDDHFMPLWNTYLAKTKLHVS